jgi:hypothetical protein
VFSAGNSRQNFFPLTTCCLQGVKLVFYDSRADVLLLEITATIPDKFNPYLLGFDASPSRVPRRAIAIHHPSGNVKRISYANNRRVTWVPLTRQTPPVIHVALHLEEACVNAADPQLGCCRPGCRLPGP